MIMLCDVTSILSNKFEHLKKEKILQKKSTKEVILSFQAIFATKQV